MFSRNCSFEEVFLGERASGLWEYGKIIDVDSIIIFYCAFWISLVAFT